MKIARIIFYGFAVLLIAAFATILIGSTYWIGGYRVVIFSMVVVVSVVVYKLLIDLYRKYLKRRKEKLCMPSMALLLLVFLAVISGILIMIGDWKSVLFVVVATFSVMAALFLIDWTREYLKK